MSTKRWRDPRNPLIKWHSEKELPDKDKEWLKNSRRIRKLCLMRPLSMHTTNSLCQRCSQEHSGLCTLPIPMRPSCQCRFPTEHTLDLFPQPILDIRSCSSHLQPLQTMPADGAACLSQITTTSLQARPSIQQSWPIVAPVTELWLWPSSIREISSPSQIRDLSTQQTSR